MSLVNLAAIRNGGLARLFMYDGQVAGPASAQSTAANLAGQLNRCEVSVANGSFILDSILTGGANGMVIVVNDSPNAILVYCAAGEKMNGTSNSDLSIASGATGVFFPVYNDLGGPDWRGAAIT